MPAIDIHTLGLGIDDPTITNDAPNFRPTCWPPEPDFPVIIDRDGNIVSRYKDSVWSLWPWTKTSSTLNFADGQTRKLTKTIDKDNADILRMIVAWWLYGHGSVKSPNTLMKYFSAIKPLFITCSASGILATELNRYPLVADKVAESVSSGNAGHFCYLLHSIYLWREELGFLLLPPESIARIAKAFVPHESNQTPYMPPRIWAYQIQRLTECLNDFLRHKEQIQKCFMFCLEVYGQHYGEISKAFDSARSRSRGSPPFSKARQKNSGSTETQLSTFQEVADHFGLSHILQKWIIGPKGTADGKSVNITSFSKYFTMIGYVGVAYILNFSMMRIKEAWNLRADCLQEEHDPTLGRFYLINGTTTKTVEDSDARWVTSPSVKSAIEAMTIVSRLRIKCAEANPAIEVSSEHIKNPWLTVRNYEPWASTTDATESVAIRPSYPSYAEFIRSFEFLYDTSEIIITDKDLMATQNVTFGMDEGRYSVGCKWAFAWHQLRRTGAVNMQSSELVSIPSMQYQLKHPSQAMSLYYGRGYSAVKLNRSARDEFVKTAYEILAKELRQVSSREYSSPYGERRKSAIVPDANLISVKELEAGLKKGMHSWRPTILGGCTKLGPCPYGGLDNIAHCGGGDGSAPCADAVFDKRKRGKLLRLAEALEGRISTAQQGSPLIKSLNAQKLALENALNVIEQL